MINKLTRAMFCNNVFMLLFLARTGAVLLIVSEEKELHHGLSEIYSS